MAAWKIYIITIVLIITIGLLFQYLIKTNKIKPNKATRLFFYDNDESFIIYWKRTEEKGFLRFTLYRIITMTIIMEIMGIFFLLGKRSFFGYEGEQSLYVSLWIGVIYGFFSSITGWIGNEVKERRIEEKIIKNKNIDDNSN